MQYLGGKKRLAKRIAAVLDAHRSEGQRFVDVFCGSLAISAAMPSRGPHVANDACVPLINMYKAWREGWRPPESLDETMYAFLKEQKAVDDPLTAFAGFGCSYSGKWFGGYARGWVLPGTRSRQSPKNGGTERADFAGAASRSLAKTLAECSEVTLSCRSFGDLEIRRGDLVYCDPEYRGTTKYSYFSSFDNDLFEATVQRWADSGASVFVSEYAQHQKTWELVSEWTSSKNIASKPRTEKLFRVRPSEVCSDRHGDALDTRRP